MTELLTRRPASASTLPQSTTMTCDVPLIQTTCRATGRRPRAVAAATPVCPAPSVRTRPARRAERTASSTTSAGRAARARSNTVDRSTAVRRRWAAGVLLGAALAAVVVVLGMVGEDYEKAVSGVPVQTEVVHVRSGESLSSLAERIAPDRSAASVIATVRDLNGLDASGLRPGQALVVPAYR